MIAQRSCCGDLGGLFAADLPAGLIGQVVDRQLYGLSVDFALIGEILGGDGRQCASADLRRAGHIRLCGEVEIFISG